MTDTERTERILDRLEKVAERLADVATELAIVADRQAGHSSEIRRLSSELNDERAARQQVRSDLDKWVQRGWGAWGVVVLLFTIVTATNWPARIEQAISQQTSSKRDATAPQPPITTK